ncbi:MAG: prephenate dehydrogenase/arogenate dehydrogenase family protein [Pseudohongiella sp.]|uniref:prephenate dehydrogenase/arogenate dehydrogenase family protein n=1 Tax=Pseudohongiella sp. TaxID=1979412 RepID=UPI0034A00EDA
MSLLRDKTVLIVGLGLIGGSIARGLAANKACHRILAVGRDETALQTAMLDGSIHAYATDLATVAPEADLIMITVPTLSVRLILEQLNGLLGDHVIITDAASVKGNVIADARRILGPGVRRFVPGHPIAGSEKSGYQASRPGLFDKRKVILTPLPDNDTLAVRTVMELWQSLGADIHAMSVERHDRVLAGTSHLPHLLAFTLVNTLVDAVSEPDRVQQVFDYAAGGFADFSRIASSDPVMWRDIFLANTQATVDILDAYVGSLQQMRSALLRADGAELGREFARAKLVRDNFFQRFQQSDGSAWDRSWQADDAVLLVGRPGLSVQGEFRVPASASTARQYLDDAVSRAAVSLLRGVPEDCATMAYVQSLRNAGVPVVGPELDLMTVYGSDAGDSPARRETGGEVVPDTVALPTCTELPANDFVVLALALAATTVPESRLVLTGVYAGIEGNEHPLLALQEMGADLQFTGDGLLSVIVSTSALHGCELDFCVAGTSPDVGSLDTDNGTDAVNEQILAYIAAGLLADGETRLRVDKLYDNVRILEACQAWQALGADITLDDKIIRVRRSTLAPGPLACRDDPEFTLVSIVLAQRASGHIELPGAGAFVAKYPGFVDRLQALGFGLTYEAKDD